MSVRDTGTGGETLEEQVIELLQALRWSKCSCWDHVCVRCRTLDKFVPGWRDPSQADSLFTGVSS